MVVVVGAGSVGFGEIHDKGVVMGKGNRQGREKKGGGYVELVGGMDGVGIVGGI